MYCIISIKLSSDQNVPGNFQLIINAVDDGDPTRVITSTVTISINRNMSPAAFQSSSYIATINDYDPPGTYILTVNATDPDPLVSTDYLEPV